MNKRSHRPRPTRTRGFSLIELVAAITILAMALTALYRSAGTSVRSAQISERQTAAVLTARSLLASHDTIPKGGMQDSGTTDDGLQWSVTATPIAQESRIGEMFPVYRVDVTVTWDGGDNQPGIHLATLKPQAPERPVTAK